MSEHDGHERITAIRATEDLTALLEAARVRLSETPALARLFTIPLQGLDEPAPPTAPVEPIDGAPAVRHGLSVLTSTHYQAQQHPMATRRAAGVIVLDTNVAALVAEVNAAKDALQRAMQALGDAAWRRWRGDIPAWRRLNRLQASRGWHGLPECPRRVSFSWVGHSMGVEQLRVAQMIARLEKQAETASHPHIEAELSRLASLPADEVIVIRRPIAPTPFANISYHDGTRQAIKTALPLLIPGRSLPVIGPLHSFAPGERRAQRLDLAIESQPLIAARHAWRYRKPYRFRLPHDPVTVRIECFGSGLRARARAFEGGEHCFPASTTQALHHLRLAAAEASGAVAEDHYLDAQARIRLVAANRANALFQVGDTQCWRVSLKDLWSLTEAAV